MKYKITAGKFYINQFGLPSAIRRYNNKINNPYGKVNDILESNVINNAFKIKQISVPRVLEIGVYTGRIHKKLLKKFSNLTVTDIDEKIIKKYKKKFILNLTKKDWSNSTQLKFDYIFSLGHQLAFSNNIENAIKILKNLLNHNGILVFDIWNMGCTDSFDPKYTIQKLSERQIKKILKKHNLNIIKYSQGQKLFYTLNFFYRVFKFITPSKIFINVIIFLENLLENSIVSKKVQTSYYIVKNNN